MAPQPGTALTLGEPGYWPEAPAGVFDVYLQGVPEGQQVEVTFWETDGTDEQQWRTERKLGSISGKTAASAKHPGRMTLIPNAPPPEVPPAELAKPVPCVVGFRLQPPVGAQAAEAPQLFRYTLADAMADIDEGDSWELVAKVEALELVSQKHTVARVRRGLGTADATYRPHDGDELTLYNDGSTDEHGSGGAFFDLLKAIQQAQSFIFIADWSFHPLFRPSRLGPDAVATWETSIGAKLIAKAGQGLLVAIHTWDHTNMAANDPQNDKGQKVFVSMLGRARPKNLLWRASSHDNTGMSHHQKFVVMDAPPPPGAKDGRRTLRVFFGGLDLTQGRFDFPAHPILPPHQGCASAWPFVQEWHTPNFVAEHVETSPVGEDSVVPQVGTQTNEWYNAEFGGDTSLPRQPWHDIYGNAWGPAAWDFVREFVGRWGCDPTWNPTWGDNSKEQMEKVHEMFRGLFDSKKYKQQWEPYDGPFTSQVLRSIIKSHWNDELEVENKDRNGRVTGREKELGWHQETLRADFEQSILRAYRQAIGQAEKFIYIETQYFIGGGKRWGVDSIQNDLPLRIVERIIERRKVGAPFHAYVVIPMYPEGDPVSWAIQEQRWLEWRAMEWMIKQLGDDWYKNLSFYFPANWTTVPPTQWNMKGGREERVRAHRRYMIYVHSKLMLVDDRFAIFGSANLNERSLAGNRDTEIACAFWPRLGREKDAIAILRAFRKQLWREHLGNDPAQVATWESPEQPSCWSGVKTLGLANYTALRTTSRRGKEGALCYLPFIRSPSDGLMLDDVRGVPEGSADLLPDSPEGDQKKAKKMGWAWSSPGSWTIRRLGLAE